MPTKIQTQSGTELIFNKAARLAVHRNGSEVVEAHVFVPTRDRGLLRYTISKERDPVTLEAFQSVLVWQRTGIACIQEHQERLMEMGLLVPREQASRPVSFECDLGDRQLFPASSPDAPSLMGLHVNPSFRYQPLGEQVPEVFSPHVLLEESLLWGHPRDWFIPTSPRAWVRDSGTGIVNAFGVPRDFQDVVSRLVPGAPWTHTVEPEQEWALRAARILVSSGDNEARARQWEATLESAHAHFQAQGYVNIRDMLSPLVLAAVRRYCAALLDEGYTRLRTGPALSWGAYGVGVTRFLHFQLARLMSRVVKQPLKPSYVFFCSYLPGAVLERHVDRENSDFSISFLLDFQPKPEGPSSWPLCLETRSGVEAAVYQHIGDGTFFQGTQMPHYRPMLPEGQRSTSVFFEFVPESYTGPLD